MSRRLFTLAIALALTAAATGAEARVYPPTNLQATAVGPSLIQLNWSDSNPNVQGFLIQRTMTQGKNWATIATTDGNIPSYTDSGLQSSTTYFYRVRTLQERRSSSGELRSPRKSRYSDPTSASTSQGLPPFPTQTPNPTSTPAPTATVPVASGGEWSKRFGGSGAEIASATATDASGNVIMVGRFTGSASFGAGMLSSAGGFDAFVAKYASDGSHLWSKRLGSSASDQANDVAFDQAGNIIVVGSFDGNVDFGGGTRTSAGQQDVFIAKYAPNGAHLWSIRAGGAEWDQALTVAADGSDNVVVGGSFHDTVNFGSAALSTSGDNVVDMFVAKYTQDGAPVWAKNFRTNYSGEVRGIAADATGRIAITGFFDGTADFGGGVMSSYQQSQDAFVAVLSSTGTYQWARSFGRNFNDFGEGVAFDATGAVVVVGQFSVQADLGGSTLTADAAGNVFVAKYSSAGAHQWSHSYGGTQDTDTASDVAIGPANSVIVTGSFAASSNNRADFGGPTLPGYGGRDVFVARYTTVGGHTSSAQYGGSGHDDGMGMAVTPTGNPVVTGTFSGTATFNAGTLTSAGSVDAFLIKLP